MSPHRGRTGNWDRREVSRRRLLAWAGMGAGALALGTNGLSGRALARPFFSGDPFSLGVASGDPLPEGVVLWTRLAPEPLAPDGSGGLPPETHGVRYEVAEDERFSRVVRRGAVEATPELAHSVHVEVDGLRLGREYFYRFKAGPEISPVAIPGRLRRRARVSITSPSRSRAATTTGSASTPPTSACSRTTWIWSCTWVTTSMRAVRATCASTTGPEPMDLPGYRNRHALYTDRAGPAEYARAGALARHVGRPRGGQQLGRRRR